MCIGIPSRVVAIGDQVATVECYGAQREVSLILMPEPVALGDYLLIQVGNFAVEKIEPERAREALAYIEQIEGLEPSHPEN